MITVNHPAASHSPLKRLDALLTLLTGAAALLIFGLTTAKGVLPYDSAEFQILGMFPAHAHNPGYWVYLLMVRAFNFLPFADPAFRASFFSAFMAAVTVACVFLAVRLLTGSRLAGVFSAAVLVVTPNFWSQSVIAEVYTSATAFSAGLLVLMLAWERTRKNSLLFWAGVLGGISPGVHGTIGLLAPAIVLLIALSRPEWKRVWKPALGGALAGLLLLGVAFFVVDANNAPYSVINTTYIPARSAFDTSLESLQTPGGRFAFLITSRQWRPMMFRNPAEETWQGANNYFKALQGEFAWVVLGLALVGFIVLWARRPRVAAFFLVAGVFHHFFVFNYPIGDIYTFYLPWYPFLLTLAGQGVALLLGLVAARPSPRVAAVIRTVVTAGVLTLAMLPFWGPSLDYLRAGEAQVPGKSFANNEQRQAWYLLIRAAAKELPENAVMFTDWEGLFAYYYASRVEFGRSDLRIHEPYPFSIRGGMADTMLAYAVEQAGQAPILSTMPIEPFVQAGLRESTKLYGPVTFYVYEK